MEVDHILASEAGASVHAAGTGTATATTATASAAATTAAATVPVAGAAAADDLNEGLLVRQLVLEHGERALL